MPRISRTTVEFDVDGKTLVAEFGHIHYDPPFVVSLPNGTPKVRHRTNCLIQDKANGVPVGCGATYCSAKDVYDWKRGVKLALLKALEAVEPEKRGQYIGAFYREMRVRV